MNTCVYPPHVQLELLDDCSSKPNSFPPCVHPPHEEGNRACCKACRERQESISVPVQDCSQPNLICTEPIPMKITCIQKSPQDEGPLGRITRNQDFDIIGSKYVYRCTCSMRNGLDNVCRRLSCRDNPACKMEPPRCWPQYQPKPEIKREIEGPVQICFVNNCEN